MIAELKPYPVMKHSGVRSLGAIPEQWQVRRLRHVAELRVSTVDKHTREGEHPVRLCNYTDVYKHDRISERMPFMQATASAEDIERFRLEAGDVLITKDSEAWNDIGVPALVEGPADDLISGYHLALLRPAPEVNGSYLFRAFQSKAVAYQLHVEANGVTRYGLAHSAIKSVWVSLPPFVEQASIVRFLDYVDRRIGRYVRSKQTLINLLEEQKQVLTHRAVTQGLDPNARLEPSGVRWLGQVPEHWSVKRFKFIARITSGQVDPRAAEHKGKVLIAPNHIQIGTGRITYQETAEEQGADSGKYEVRKGQVLYSKIRPNLRKVAIAPVDGLCSADMYPIAVKEGEIRPSYLLLLLLSAPFTRYAIDCSLRVAMPKVNREALGGAWLWYPSLDEQDAILRRVNAVARPFDAAVGQAELEISLLREYRTRLISDVVTGKLDVREAAARLQDDGEEPVEKIGAFLDAEEGMIDDVDAVPEGVTA